MPAKHNRNSMQNNKGSLLRAGEHLSQEKEENKGKKRLGCKTSGRQVHGPLSRNSPASPRDSVSWVLSAVPCAWDFCVAADTN